jgi:hypothetical protein
MARLVPALGLGALRFEEIPDPGRGWVRVDMARSTIKPFLIPLHGLDDLMRINTEA